MRTQIVRCIKSSWKPDHCPETILFKLDIGRLGIFIRPEDMPPFEGGEGLVETMGPSTAIRVLRQVDPSAKPRELTTTEKREVYLATRKSKPASARSSAW